MRASGSLRRLQRLQTAKNTPTTATARNTGSEPRRNGVTHNVKVPKLFCQNQPSRHLTARAIHTHFVVLEVSHERLYISRLVRVWPSKLSSDTMSARFDPGLNPAIARHFRARRDHTFGCLPLKGQQFRTFVKSLGRWSKRVNDPRLLV